MNKWGRFALFVVILGIALWVLIALSGCGDSGGTPKWKQVPKPKPTMGVPVEPSAPPVMQLGATCSPPGIKARTASGSPLRCMVRPGEQDPIWRIE